MKKRIKILYILILIGALCGTCLFFPVQMSGGSTCLYQFFHDSAQLADQIQIYSNNLRENVHHRAFETGLTDYLHHYAFLWWTSLGLLVFSFYRLRKQKLLKGES